MKLYSETLNTKKCQESLTPNTVSYTVSVDDQEYKGQSFLFLMGEEEPEGVVYTLFSPCKKGDRYLMFRTSLRDVRDDAAFASFSFGYTSRGASKSLGFVPKSVHKMIQKVINGYLAGEASLRFHVMGKPEQIKKISKNTREINFRKHLPKYTVEDTYPDGVLVRCVLGLYIFKQVGYKETLLLEVPEAPVKISFDEVPELFEFVEGNGHCDETIYGSCFFAHDHETILPYDSLDMLNTFSKLLEKTGVSIKEKNDVFRGDQNSPDRL